MARRFFSLFFVAGLAIACSDSSPKGISPLPLAPTSSTSLAMLDRTALTSEDFDCSGVGEVHVRFGAPGFVDGLRVGLYVNYTDVPPGEKLLRIWWDLEDHFEKTQDVRISETDVDRVGGRLVFETIVEHHYRDISAPTRFLVRSELITVGNTGNCARNREITVSPSRVEEDEKSPPCDGGECTVFVTSTRHDGDLGGLDGADGICQERAREAGLPGSFKAWLSDDASSPATRFTHAETPYVLTSGARIASSWNELTTALTRHIDVDERGNPVGFGTVWTRTRSDGTAAFFALGPDCDGWTNGSSGYGTNGQHDGNLLFWSFFGASSCGAELQLYCFQQ
jgi:hypothetical protein